MKRFPVVLAIAVVLGIWLVLSFWSDLRSVAEKPPAESAQKTLPVPLRTTVAKVNSAPLTAGELEEEFNRLLPLTTAHGGADPKKMANLRKAALEELIARELAYQRAQAMQLQVESDALEATIKKIKGRYKMEQSFQEALRAEEITEQEFVHRVEKDLLLRKIYKTEIEDQAKISDSEVREFYEKNKAKFQVPESIHLQHIVIKNTLGNGADAEKRATRHWPS